jgi:hypothetical protein
MVAQRAAEQRERERADEAVSSSSSEVDMNHFDHLTAGVSSLTHALRFVPQVDLASALPSFPSAAPLSSLSATASPAAGSRRARSAPAGKGGGKVKSVGVRAGAVPVQGKLRKLKQAYTSVAKLVRTERGA